MKKIGRNVAHHWLTLSDPSLSHIFRHNFSLRFIPRVHHSYILSLMSVKETSLFFNCLVEFRRFGKIFSDIVGRLLYKVA